MTGSGTRSSSSFTTTTPTPTTTTTTNNNNIHAILQEYLVHEPQPNLVTRGHHINSFTEDVSEIKRAPSLYLKMCAFPRTAVSAILRSSVYYGCLLSIRETPEQFRPHFNSDILCAM